MMKMKELKDLIKDLDDDMDVVIVNGADAYLNHISMVSSCGVITCKLEDKAAFGLMSSTVNNIKDEIGNGDMYRTKLLFDNFPAGYSDKYIKEGK